MKKMTLVKITKGAFLLSLYGIYYSFIGLILAMVFSENPNVYELGLGQWPAYLAITGCMIGVYLSLSSCISLIDGIFSNQYKNIHWNRVCYMGILVQMIWIILPAQLVRHAESLRTINHWVVIFSVVFLLSLATSRRNKLQIIGGAL